MTIPDNLSLDSREMNSLMPLARLSDRVSYEINILSQDLERSANTLIRAFNHAVNPNDANDDGETNSGMLPSPTRPPTTTNATELDVELVDSIIQRATRYHVKLLLLGLKLKLLDEVQAST